MRAGGAGRGPGQRRVPLTSVGAFLAVDVHVYEVLLELHRPVRRSPVRNRITPAFAREAGEDGWCETSPSPLTSFLGGDSGASDMPPVSQLDTFAALDAETLSVQIAAKFYGKTKILGNFQKILPGEFRKIADRVSPA